MPSSVARIMPWFDFADRGDYRNGCMDGVFQDWDFFEFLDSLKSTTIRSLQKSSSEKSNSEKIELDF